MNKSTLKYVPFKKDVIIIKYNNQIHTGDNIFQTNEPYRENHIIGRNLRKIWNKLSFPLESIWYNKDLKNINASIIIIFDSIITKKFLEWIRKQHPNIRIIFWYWNPMNKKSAELLNVQNVEFWSYSSNDAKKYNISHNHQFYFSQFSLPRNTIKHDVFFIGKDKNRWEYLLDLKEQFSSLHLISKFHITKTKRAFPMRKYPYQKQIPYLQVLSEISKSKSILEVLKNPMDGLSFRAMEALFFKKKLITNSLTIKFLDFYDPQNIFILGENDINSLPKFLNSPYKDVENKILSRYKFECWLKQFF